MATSNHCTANSSAVDHCTANTSAVGCLSCKELAESFVAGCAGNLMSTMELQRARLLANAEGAAAAGREAQPWQIAMVTLVLASILYNHGRWFFWVVLSMTLLVCQGLYVAWQMGIIALDILMYTWLMYCHGAFYVCESVQRWAVGGNIRHRWRLRRRLRRATAWPEYSRAARELDELDNKSAWRSSPSGYAASGVATASRQLRAAREAGEAEELVQLLRTMMQRNHLQVDRHRL